MCSHLCHCCSLSCCILCGQWVFPQWSAALCRHPCHWWHSSPRIWTGVWYCPTPWTNTEYASVKNILHTHMSHIAITLKLQWKKKMIWCVMFSVPACVWFLTYHRSSAQPRQPSSARWASLHRGNHIFCERLQPPMGVTLWVWKSHPQFCSVCARSSRRMSALEGHMR